MVQKFQIFVIGKCVLFVVFNHGIPLARLDERNVVVSLDAGNFLHRGDAFGKQLADLRVNVVNEGSLLAKEIVGVVGGNFVNERLERFSEAGNRKLLLGITERAFGVAVCFQHQAVAAIVNGDLCYLLDILSVTSYVRGVAEERNVRSAHFEGDGDFP